MTARFHTSAVEMIAVRLGLVVLISITVFFAFLSTAFLLWKYTGLVSAESTLKWTGLCGLGIGLVPGMALQAALAPRFYVLPAGLLVAGYLLLALLMIGAGMGVPVGAPVLGVIVGLYVARRSTLLVHPAASFRSSLRKATVRTVAVTFALLAMLWSASAVRAAKGLGTGIPDFTGSRALSEVGFLIAVVIFAPAAQALFAEIAGRFIFRRGGR